MDRVQATIKCKWFHGLGILCRYGSFDLVSLVIYEISLIIRWWLRLAPTTAYEKNDTLFLVTDQKAGKELVYFYAKIVRIQRMHLAGFEQRWIEVAEKWAINDALWWQLFARIVRGVQSPTCLIMAGEHCIRHFPVSTSFRWWIEWKIETDPIFLHMVLWRRSPQTDRAVQRPRENSEAFGEVEPVDVLVTSMEKMGRAQKSHAGPHTSFVKG